MTDCWVSVILTLLARLAGLTSPAFGKEVKIVKRILLVLTVAALFALLLIVAGLPAVAAGPNCNSGSSAPGSQNPNCVLSTETNTTIVSGDPGSTTFDTVLVRGFQPGAAGKGRPTTTT